MPRQLIEAGQAFGATRWQLLKKVELSTATKEEMECLSDLDKAMKRLKAELTATTAAIKSHTEDMLKS